MIKFGEQTKLMIIIWLLLTFTMLVILMFSLLNDLLRNKKKNFFTVKKITLLATFLSILIIQTVIDRLDASIPGMPSFESMTTITIGFIFGVAEGIMFGWMADTLIVLIHGWSYQILPSLMMPFIGMISGYVGVVYLRLTKQDDINNINNLNSNVSVQEEMGKVFDWKLFLIFQSIMLTMVVLMLTTSLTLVNVVGEDKAKNLQLIAPITCLISVLILEALFVYYLTKGIDEKLIYLLLAILVVAILERTLEVVVRPFSQSYYYGYDYFVELYIRLLRSTYLIPSVTITSFLLIRTTLMAINI